MPNQPAAAAAPQAAAAAASAEGAAAATPVEGSSAGDEAVADAEAAAVIGEDDTRSAKSTARSAAPPVEVEPPAPFALRFMLQKTKINFETSLPDLEAAVARMFDELGAFFVLWSCVVVMRLRSVG